VPTLAGHCCCRGWRRPSTAPLGATACARATGWLPAAPAAIGGVQAVTLAAQLVKVVTLVDAKESHREKTDHEDQENDCSQADHDRLGHRTIHGHGLEVAPARRARPSTRASPACASTLR
jgi:hypothetical protein